MTRLELNSRAPGQDTFFFSLNHISWVSRFLFTSFLLHRHILYSLVHSKSIYQELTVCCVLTLYPQESHSLGRETDQQVSKVIVCEALSGWMEHGCLGSTEKGCLLQSWWWSSKVFPEEMTKASGASGSESGWQDLPHGGNSICKAPEARQSFTGRWLELRK